MGTTTNRKSLFAINLDSLHHSYHCRRHRKRNKEAGTPYIESIKTAQVGDIRMAYQILGQGEPLVMITGLNVAMDLWDHRILGRSLINYPGDNLRQPGYGIHRYLIGQLLHKTVCQRHCPADGCPGHRESQCFGLLYGILLVAQELAINHPEKVKRLILFAGNCGGPQAIQPAPEIFRAVPDLSDPSNLTQQELSGFFETMFPSEWLAKNPDVYKIFTQAKESSSPENMMRQTMAVVHWPGSYDRLDQIKAPTMIVAGMKDAMIPPANSLILAERINGSWLVRFENAGHRLIFQYPDEMARIVADFMRSQLRTLQ